MSEAFMIHSLVRDVSTRHKRQIAPTRHRFVQRLAGGTIIVRRNRPATVTKDRLLKHLDEIQQGVEEGKLVVKTMVGEVVDLETFKVEPAPKSPPLPVPPLDDVAKDKTFEAGVGEKRPLFPGGSTPDENPAPPSLKPPLTSDDTPIKTSGDPAKARAEQKTEPRSALVEKPAEKSAAKPGEKKEEKK